MIHGSALDMLEATPAISLASLLDVLRITLPYAALEQENMSEMLGRTLNAVVDLLQFQFQLSYWHFLMNPVLEIVIHPLVAGNVAVLQIASSTVQQLLFL